MTEKKKYCRHCGSENDSDASFCTSCGQDISDKPNVNQTMNTAQSTASSDTHNHQPQSSGVMDKLLQNKKLLAIGGAVIVALVLFLTLTGFELKGDYVREDSMGTYYQFNVNRSGKADMIESIEEMGDISFQFHLAETEEVDEETGNTIYVIDGEEKMEVVYDLKSSAIEDNYMSNAIDEMVMVYGMERQDKKDRVVLTGSFDSQHPFVTQILNDQVEVYRLDDEKLSVNGAEFIKK